MEEPRIKKTKKGRQKKTLIKTQSGIGLSLKKLEKWHKLRQKSSLDSLKPLPKSYLFPKQNPAKFRPPVKAVANMQEFVAQYNTPAEDDYKWQVLRAQICKLVSPLNVTKGKYRMPKITQTVQENLHKASKFSVSRLPKGVFEETIPVNKKIKATINLAKAQYATLRTGSIMETNSGVLRCWSKNKSVSQEDKFEFLNSIIRYSRNNR